MKHLIKSLSTKAVSFLLALLLSLGFAQPASADETAVDTKALDMSATPELAYQALSVDVNSFCFFISTNAENDTVYKFADLAFSGVRNGETVSVELGSREYYVYDNQFSICTVDNEWNVLPEIGDAFAYSSISISGRSVLATTFSKAFEDQLKTYGLGITEGTPLSVYYNPYSGSQFAVEIVNNSKKVVSVKLSNFKFADRSIGTKSFTLVLAPKGTQYMNFGSLKEDVSAGFADADVSAKFTGVKVAKVVRKKIKVPAGLQLKDTAPTDWYYYPSDSEMLPKFSNATNVCQMVKNTSKKAITVQSRFSFSAPKRKTLGYLGTSVDTIPAGETYCLAGAYDSRNNPSGDWRLDNTVTVDGSLEIVKATTVDTKALKLPESFSVASTFVSYDSTNKTSEVTLVINAPAEFNSDLLMNDLTFNGKSNLSVVAQSCQCGGPGITNRLVVSLGFVKGDIRVGKKLSAKGTFVTSSPVQLSWNVDYNYALGCYAWYPGQWKYSSKTNKTTVMLFCNNLSSSKKKLDISGLTLKVTIGETSAVYSPISRSINLPAWSQSKVVEAFQVTGDVRTGGAQVEFSGTIK